MTVSWWNRRLCAFDLETTSPDPEEARIVTAAIALVGGGAETQTYTWLVDPGCEIPEEATAVHGITTERARAEGDNADVAIAEILTALSDFRPESAPIIVFNARYDFTVLDREARRRGLNPLGTGRPFYVIDPLVIDKHIDRYRKGERKLAVMCAHYRATLDDAHDAAFDAIAAARLAWRIGRQGQIVRRVWNADMGREKAELVREWESVRGDLALLHEAQRRWAHDQAVGLAQHFREHPEKGADPDEVQTAWPVVPIRTRTAA